MYKKSGSLKNEPLMDIMEKLQTSATHTNGSLSATTNLYFELSCTSLQRSQINFQKNNGLFQFFFSLCKTNEKKHNKFLALERLEKLSV